MERNTSCIWLSIALIISLCAVVLDLEAAVIYVDKDATGAADGTTWADAFTNLQDAIDASQSGDRIWVAEGTYFPTSDKNGDSSPADPRDLVFDLKDGVKMYGGFLGTETMLGERDPDSNATILSGDIGVPGDSTDNCYIVVLGESLSEGTLFDGFRVRKANAIGSYFNPFSFTYTEAGAMRIRNSRLIIRNTRFSGNTEGEGAGLNSVSSQLRIVRCAFSNNSGTSIYRSDNMSTDTICNSVFTTNDGPAIESFGVYIFNCTLYDNLFGVLIKSDTKIYNTIIARSTLQGVLDQGGTVPAYDVQNCIFDDGVQNLRTYQNVQVADPRLTDPSGFDFTPASCSPAVNAGESAWAVFPFLPDFMDQPRNFGMSIDIGAVEFQGSPTSVSDITIYVDESATGGNDGTSWVDAYTTLVDAVDQANSMGICEQAEIRVAEGKYYASKTDTPEDVLALEASMKIYGGFPAGGGTQASRDWENQKTVISGDIGVQGVASDNSIQLVRFEALDSNSIFNGFYFEEVYLTEDNAAIEFQDCNFVQFKNVVCSDPVDDAENNARLINTEESSVVFDNISITGADLYSVIRTIPPYLYIEVEPGIQELIFTDCKFDSNACETLIYANFESLVFDHCEFRGNEADLIFSSPYEDVGDVRINYCEFYNNIFITCFNAREIVFYSSLFANQVGIGDSEADLFEVQELLTVQGSTIFDHSEYLVVERSFGNADVELQNSILSGLYLAEFEGFNSSADFTFENSMTRMEYPGQVNWIEGPPRYADIQGEDFTLRNCSPGKNVGDNSLYSVPALDIYGNTRIVGTLDIGAIESPTIFQAPLPLGNLYVDSSATGIGSGLSWIDAKPVLSDAMLDISVGELCYKVDTVFVAQGTYLPLETSDTILPIPVVGDIVLLGGYPSGGGERDIEANATIISGDTGVPAHDGDNATTLVRVSSQTEASLIDGFHFIQGRFSYYGGVLAMVGSQATVSNCEWRDNGTAETHIIGLVEVRGSGPTFDRCVFEENYIVSCVYTLTTLTDTMYFSRCRFSQNQSEFTTAIYTGSEVSLSECSFEGNVSELAGIVLGEIYHVGNCAFVDNQTLSPGYGTLVSSGNMFVDHSVFMNNSVAGDGGAIDFSDGDLTILNSLFAQNTAVNGGAIHLEGNDFFTATTATILNSTFDQNAAGAGQSIYADIELLEIYNSILWGVGPSVSWTVNTPLNFDYNVYSAASIFTTLGSIGPNNLLGVDPLFLDAGDIDGPDDIIGTIDDGLQPQKQSPVKEAGDNVLAVPVIDTDLAGRTRKLYEHVDIGAYELPCSHAPENLYIALNASGSGTATTWEDAGNNIRAALLNFEVEGCLTDSIKIAQGTYAPSNSGNRSHVIDLPSGSTLIGGFDVQNGIEVDWNPEVYTTSITGEIGGTSDQDNSYRLITFKDYEDTTIIVGLTLTNAVDSVGSALYAPVGVGSSPVFIDRVNIHNHISPAAVFNQATMRIRNSTFADNTNAAGRRRGIANYGNLILQDATFTGASVHSSDRYMLNGPGGIVVMRGAIGLSSD